MDTNEIYIKKIHNEILNIMNDVKRVCDENNLSYYIIAGTLLGAVRHKGFIPWDDDLDIVMPRKDFDRFILLADHKLSNPYKLVWTTNHSDYWNAFAKVENTNTVFLESSSENASLKYGIYIDIFPIDEVKCYSKKLEIIKRRVLFIRGIQKLKSGSESPTGIKKHVQALIGLLRSENEWAKEKERLMSSQNGKGYLYYANFGSFYSIKRQTMPKEYYGDGVELLFEGMMLKAPSKYTEVLTSIYGPQYTELPPVEKRTTHYPAMVKFSDGEMMIFDTSKYHRVNTKN